MAPAPTRTGSPLTCPVTGPLAQRVATITASASGAASLPSIALRSFNQWCTEQDRDKLFGDRHGHADRVTTATNIKKRFIDPTLLERPGYSAPPRLYNEDKYEGL